MKAYARSPYAMWALPVTATRGKTQLVSSLLFTAGMTTRLGKVAEGNTVTGLG